MKCEVCEKELTPENESEHKGVCKDCNAEILKRLEKNNTNETKPSKNNIKKKKSTKIFYIIFIIIIIILLISLTVAIFKINHLNSNFEKIETDYEEEIENLENELKETKFQSTVTSLVQKNYEETNILFSTDDGIIYIIFENFDLDENSEQYKETISLLADSVFENALQNYNTLLAIVYVGNLMMTATYSLPDFTCLNTEEYIKYEDYENLADDLLILSTLFDLIF